MSADVGSPGYTPDPDHNDHGRHKGARVRVLGTGTGTLVSNAPDPFRQWVIRLDEPSQYPGDARRHHIVRTAGEFTVITEESPT